jgi:phosphoenolpyruvate carboxykinase (ATP)
MGGSFNAGSRIDLQITRRIINAILYGVMDGCEFNTIPVFNLAVPSEIEGVDSNLLDPGKVWDSPHRWHIAATDLAMKFILNFNKFSVNEETAKLADFGPRI